MTAPLKLALIGLGTVGQGVVELMQRNGEVIAARLGRRLQITGIAVRDLGRARAVNIDGIPLTDDAEALARDGDYDVLVELIGGETTARTVTEIAFSRGKSVVNANKALIARHGNALLAQAESAGVGIGFEAAVAGGIPVLKALREGLAGNQVSELAGIINGTSNYILTQMGSKGQAFADALADAQRLGYAEADPTFDIEGVDAAHKLTILASLAFGIPLDFDALSIEGISTITPQDIRIARELGYAIKHLGIAKREHDGGVSLRVHPTLIPAEHLLAKVDGVLNAVLMRGDGAGPGVWPLHRRCWPTSSTWAAWAHGSPRPWGNPSPASSRPPCTPRTMPPARSICVCGWPTRRACSRASPRCLPSWTSASRPSSSASRGKAMTPPWH